MLCYGSGESAGKPEVATREVGSGRDVTHGGGLRCFQHYPEQ